MIDDKKWFQLLCESYHRPPVFFNGERLPGFPPDIVQTNTTGQCGEATLTDAFAFYRECLDMFRSAGKGIFRESRLLDFGVGWGRIARFFLREFAAEHIHGVDVVDSFIDICRETFQSENFHLSQPFPPTPYPDGTFQFIVGYSVFSHLSETACRKWMEEFHRITAPGAVVILTTRGSLFMDYCESLQGRGLDGYSHWLSIMFDDFRQARRRYDQGEFLHSNALGLTGGGVLTPDFYGETFIPEQYARQAYGDLFDLMAFKVNPAIPLQPIMLFRRKSSAA